jgi:hypothetical protein
MTGVTFFNRRVKYSGVWLSESDGTSGKAVNRVLIGQEATVGS